MDAWFIICKGSAVSTLATRALVCTPGKPYLVTLIAALIAGGLYGDIGIKVVYNNILVDIFRVPPMDIRRGKIIYALLVPLWWIIAFIIGAALPDYFGFVSVMSASMLLNLSYTLPPLFVLGFDIQKNSIRAGEGEGFNLITGEVIRNGSATQRWIHGLFSGGWLQVAINIMAHYLLFGFLVHVWTWNMGGGCW